MPQANRNPSLIGCASALEVGELSFLSVRGVEAELRAGKLTDDARKQVIEAINSGKHVELDVQAIVFRQRDGSPNKNFLRFKTEKLGEIASSFVGKPLLLDHNKWEQTARMGTIIASELTDLAHGWAGFRQTLRVVKPHAVISVLDGTLDAYSIGWDPSGAVFCTAHKVDLRGKASCRCWPGDRVEVDGRNEIAEYEWQSTEGLETSGVNTPAVSRTKNEEVRVALAAELNLTSFIETPPEPITMKNVNALLGLPVEATEENAVRLITELQRGKLAAEQERDTARTELTAVKTELSTSKDSALKVQVDSLIAGAYKDGKLKWGRDSEGKAIPSAREPRLRRIAKDDGIGVLTAEIDDMPVVVPIGQQQLSRETPRERAALPEDYSSALSSVEKQLGLEPGRLSNQQEG